MERPRVYFYQEDFLQSLIGRDISTEESVGIYRGPIRRILIGIYQESMSLDFCTEWIAIRTNTGWRLHKQPEADHEAQSNGIILCGLQLDNFNPRTNEEGIIDFSIPYIGLVTIHKPGDNLNKDDLII